MTASEGGQVPQAFPGREEGAPARIGLRRDMGLGEAVALGVGGTIGGGIFVLVGSAAGAAGPGALIAFGLAFLASLAIAVPYAELACRYPEAGGGYAFARMLLGRRVGFLMGWGFWGAYVFISGYVTLGFGGYLQALVGPSQVVGAVLLVAACTLVNVAGIRFSGRFQVVVVSLALAGLLAFAALGAGHANPGLLVPLLPRGWSGVLTAALLAFLAFGGFDMVAAAGEEVRHPERNLPLAILLTLVVVLAVYFLVTFVALETLPWQTLGASRAPLRDAARAFGGPVGAALVSAAAVLTTAATGNAVLVVTSRISFAMARDGLLPAALARVHSGSGTPWVAILVNGVLLALVALTGSLRVSTSIGGFLYVAHFVPSVLAVLMPQREGGAVPAFRTPARRILVPFALGMCLVLLAASGAVGVLGGLLWLALGTALRRPLAAPASGGVRGGPGGQRA
jgi:APA family basic amino acid/polyamine antiporter